MDEAPTSRRGTAQRAIVFLVVLATVGILYYQFADSLTLESLSARESTLRDFQRRHPLLVFGIAFAFYVTVTGLSLPGAAALSLVYGWYFGLLRGFVLVSFASTSGATVAFLLSRYLFRQAVQQRFGQRLKSFNDALEKEGAFYLFTLRLIPAVPFFVINVVMGLTSMRAWTFWWVSQLGMLAGTLVYVYAGSSVPDLNTLAQQGTAGILTPQLLIAFAALGIFPLAMKKLMQTIRRQTIET